MRRFLGSIAVSLLASGQTPRRRALRITAELLLIAAAVLLISAGVLALNQPPTRKPLHAGVIFNQPISTAIAGPPLELMTTPPPPTAPPTEAPTPEPTATPEPTPEPTPPPNESPVARVMIPSIKVNAPVSFKGVDAHGVMEDPNSWNDVAYYGFSGKPGFGSGNNAVFAGHVDYIHHGAAVFWDLNKLKPGDEIHVVLQDGTDYDYRVTQMVVYTADSAPVEQILGDTPTESVTLITCEGTFAAGHYNNRLVVRAERA